VLASAGLSAWGPWRLPPSGARPPPLPLALRALLALQRQPPTQQALRWLWDLALGQERPWSGASRPAAEVMRLDGLREWLHRFVTVSVLPWHRLEAFRLDPSYEGLFPEEAQHAFSQEVGLVAASLLLAVECTPTPSNGGLEAVLSTAELVSGILAALQSGEDAGERARVLALLLLARCLRSREALSLAQSRPDDRGWRGIVVACPPTALPRPDAAGGTWRPPGGPPEDLAASGLVERLCFPGLDVDRLWLHSQYGTRGPTDTSAAARATVQLDAKFHPQAGCFLGQWTELHGSEPLPLRAFPVAAPHEGLCDWVSAASSAGQGQHLPGQGAGRAGGARTPCTTPPAGPGAILELFGVVGGSASQRQQQPQQSPGAALGFFHLARAQGG